MDREQYIVDGRETVAGWFFQTDARLFDAIDAAQREAGLSGDLLEIGCYQGASAILLGYMRQDSERLVVCDLFDGVTTDLEEENERRRFYMDLNRQSFEENYRRFHDDLPEIVVGPSSVLHSNGLDRTFRFIHVDGSHAFDAVRSDLMLARRLLVPGGVVAFDDIVSMHTPGVSAAVWEGVLKDGLVPLIQSRKFYGTWGKPIQFNVPDGLPTYPHEVLGHRMLHVEDAPLVVHPTSDDGNGSMEVSDRERHLILVKRRVITALRRPVAQLGRALFSRPASDGLGTPTKPYR